MKGERLRERGWGREGKKGGRECAKLLCRAFSAGTNLCLQEGVHVQLRHLPYPSELYKSYFPSWKMLEDAICPHPVLREHITEVKEDLKSVLSDQIQGCRNAHQFLPDSGLWKWAEKLPGKSRFKKNHRPVGLVTFPSGKWIFKFTSPVGR